MLAALSLFLATAGAAVQSGPTVGAKMPPFDAPDQNGQVHTLQSLMGPKGVVLVFYRSADW